MYLFLNLLSIILGYLLNYSRKFQNIIKVIFDCTSILSLLNNTIKNARISSDFSIGMNCYKTKN